MKRVKARHVVLPQSLKKPLRTKASGLRHCTIITAGCAVLSREFETMIDANFCTYCINRNQAILSSVHTNESESYRKTRMTGTLAHLTHEANAHFSAGGPGRSMVNQDYSQHRMSRSEGLWYCGLYFVHNMYVKIVYKCGISLSSSSCKFMSSSIFAILIFALIYASICGLERGSTNVSSCLSASSQRFGYEYSCVSPSPVRRSTPPRPVGLTDLLSNKSLVKIFIE